MKLLNLHIHGFGKFHDRSITFQDGLNVIYGHNEAGKSTFHTFIRGMLFGIDKQRGRASKNDLYSKYEPWENSGTYEGTLRLEYEGMVYRIERSFQKSNKTLAVINETLGRKVVPDKAFLDKILCGLNETTYNNTISIGQLKSATDDGMVTELRNYIANMNTSGSMELNITKATTYLKNQRKKLEARLVPDAARSYSTLIGEIKGMEREIAAPEYENTISSFQEHRNEAHNQLELHQQEKEQLLQNTARGREILSHNQLTDLNSILTLQKRTQSLYKEYMELKAYCNKKTPRIIQLISLLLATALLAASGYLFFIDKGTLITHLLPLKPLFVCAGAAGAGIVFYLLALYSFLSGKHDRRDYSICTKELQEIFNRYLGSSDISSAAMAAFSQKMSEYQTLSAAMDKSEAAIKDLAEKIASLQKEQSDCIGVIERQQKNQWELEKMLETLSNYKTQAEGLKRALASNEHISMEIEAINLAQETLTDLSSSIKDSFGLYLNKTASQLIEGITDGIYTTMSVDENLNVFLNTPRKLVPLEQVSSGTVDQVYLALRLAAAKLIQSGQEQMPLIFDDSFALYDDNRLKSALKWIANAYKGQIIIFTCHQREAQMLTANQIPYHLITIT